MRGWRSKIIFLLVIYFAGFATAIYCLAPAPENTSQPGEKSFAYSTVKSDEFARSFRSGMHKCLGLAKDAAGQAGDFLKQKLEETEAES